MAAYDWLGALAGISEGAQRVQENLTNQSRLRYQMGKDQGTWEPAGRPAGPLGFFDALFGYNPEGTITLGGQRYVHKPYEALTEQDVRDMGLVTPGRTITQEPQPLNQSTWGAPLRPGTFGVPAAPSLETIRQAPSMTFKPLAPTALQVAPPPMQTADRPIEAFVGTRLSPDDKMRLALELMKMRAKKAEDTGWDARMAEVRQLSAPIDRSLKPPAPSHVPGSQPGVPPAPPQAGQPYPPVTTGTPPAETTAPTRPAGASRRLPPLHESVTPDLQQQIDAEFDANAKLHNIRPELLKSLGRFESQYNPQAVSRTGHRGIMQIGDEVITEQKVTDPFDIKQNIRAGTAHFAQLLKKHNGNEELAIAEYNAGAVAMQKHGNKIPPFPETQDLVKNVLAHAPAPSAKGQVAGPGVPATGQPPAGTTGQPPAGTTGQPAAGTTGQPAAGTTGQPAAGTTGQPAGQPTPPDEEGLPPFPQPAPVLRATPEEEEYLRRQKALLVLTQGMYSKATRPEQREEVRQQLDRVEKNITTTEKEINDRLVRAETQWFQEKQAWFAEQRAKRAKQTPPAPTVTADEKSVTAQMFDEGLVDDPDITKLPATGPRSKVEVAKRLRLVSEEKAWKDQNSKEGPYISNALDAIMQQERTPIGLSNPEQRTRAQTRGLEVKRAHDAAIEEDKRIVAARAPLRAAIGSYITFDTKQPKHPLAEDSPQEATRKGYFFATKPVQDTVNNGLSANATIQRMQTLLMGGVDVTGEFVGEGKAGQYFPGIYNELKRARTVVERTGQTFDLQKHIIAGSELGQWVSVYQNLRSGLLASIGRNLGEDRGHFSDEDARRAAEILVDLGTWHRGHGFRLGLGQDEAMKKLQGLYGIVNERMRSTLNKPQVATYEWEKDKQAWEADSKRAYVAWRRAGGGPPPAGQPARPAAGGASAPATAAVPSPSAAGPQGGPAPAAAQAPPPAQTAGPDPATLTRIWTNAGQQLYPGRADSTYTPEERQKVEALAYELLQKESSRGR